MCLYCTTGLVGVGFVRVDWESEPSGPSNTTNPAISPGHASTHIWNLMIQMISAVQVDSDIMDIGLTKEQLSTIV